ncbi:MAG: hypothetical protein JST85_01085 [Acidobacteria bacterium]|nr:hypothetical protein [Acidobacteriota bacterium]
MQQIPVLSGLWSYLTAPDLPRTALAISETHLSIVTLRKTRGEFEPRNLGVLRLPDGLVKSSFTEPNISSEASLADYLTKTAKQAGINRPRALSVALPSGSARSHVISLDSNPPSRKELAQVLDWKIERAFGQKSYDLKTSYSKLRDSGGFSQWLVSAVHHRVLEQYERIFKELRWPVGLILPQHLGEAQWLMRQRMDDDQVIVSLNEHGFTTVIVRGNEPILVREVECLPEEREDEFYRIIVFYRDRLVPETEPIRLSRVLTLGTPAEQRGFREVVVSALEDHAVALDTNQIGLKVDPSAPFNHFAAASGLATMAWGY